MNYAPEIRVKRYPINYICTLNACEKMLITAGITHSMYFHL